MKKIIALVGKGDTGKTTTLILLEELLKTSELGWHKVYKSPTNHTVNFIAILEKKGKHVGLCLWGDNPKEINKRLTQLFGEETRLGVKIDLLISAVQPQFPTMSELRELGGEQGFDTELIEIPKTVVVGPSLFMQSNMTDVGYMLYEISRLLPITT